MNIVTITLCSAALSVYVLCSATPLQDEGFRYKGIPTIRKAPRLDADFLAMRLYKAMTGFGTDENTLIHILTSISNEQRQTVKHRYNSVHRTHSLSYKLADETSGTLRKGLLALVEEAEKLDYYTLRSAISTKNTALLLSILISSEHPYILESRYNDFLHSSLDSEIKSAFPDALYNAIRLLLRSESSAYVDRSRAKRDASVLSSSLDKYVTKQSDLDKVLRIVLSSHINQLNATISEVCKHHSIYLRNCEIYKDLENAFSHIDLDLAKLLQYRVMFARNRPTFFAEEFYDAIRSKDDDRLVYLSTSRSEIDLGSIFLRYKSNYRVELEDDFINLSGHRHLYLELFLAILEGN